MKVQSLDNHSYHQRCVCQICTCHKHKCPHALIEYPLGEVSTYQHQYVPHPLNPWMKPPPEKVKPYEPYDGINSSYRDHYPGHKPTMRQKIVPRVKNQDKNIPFDGTSEYRNKFPGKSVVREPVKIKDKEYNPCKSPFQGDSTYKSDYDKKNPNPHHKKEPVDVNFPPGYGFYGGTTYNNDFTQKPIDPTKSYKPIEKVGDKGPHDLNTIHRQDYTPKQIPQPCPVIKLPERPTKIHHPSQHLIYNKFQRRWEEK